MSDFTFKMNACKITLSATYQKTPFSGYKSDATPRNETSCWEHPIVKRWHDDWKNTPEQFRSIGWLYRPNVTHKKGVTVSIIKDVTMELQEFITMIHSNGCVPIRFITFQDNLNRLRLEGIAVNADQVGNTTLSSFSVKSLTRLA